MPHDLTIPWDRFLHLLWNYIIHWPYLPVLAILFLLIVLMLALGFLPSDPPLSSTQTDPYDDPGYNRPEGKNDSNDRLA